MGPHGANRGGSCASHAWATAESKDRTTARRVFGRANAALAYDEGGVAKVKGVVVLNVRAFVIAREGREAWERVLAALAPEDRDVLAGAIPVGWYDMSTYERIHRALIDTLGGGDPAIMIALGRYAAEQDLKTIHRLFLRAANPAYVLERAAEYWARFQDSGTWSIVREAPDRVHATLAGWGSEDEATCVRLGGYIQRLFELVGARDVVVQRPRCRARGDDACVFAGAWR